MFVHRHKHGLIGLTAALTLALAATASGAESHERIRIPAGRAEVVTSSDDVRTVAIAEPKIADAAVGSARTVVVNGKAPGITTLVIYGTGARYSVYDVEVYVPNANQQVQLAVQVAEVDDRARRELGIDLLGAVQGNNPQLDGLLTGGLYTAKVASPSVPLSIGPETDGFAAYAKNDGTLKLQATWKALEEKGDIRVLAQPTLVARSGEKATFRSGGEFPVPIASSVGGVASVVTVTIEWKAFGVLLDFTPTVEEDSSITLRVEPEVSELDYSNAVSLPYFRVPSVVTRRTSTTVNLKRGEHLVIGGLKQSNKTKTVKRVPILGELPLIGLLFSTTLTENVDHELMVVVSPELLTGALTTVPTLPTERPAKAH